MGSVYSFQPLTARNGDRGDTHQASRVHTSSARGTANGRIQIGKVASLLTKQLNMIGSFL